MSEKSGSRVKCRNALGQSDCRMFKLEYLKNYCRYKAYFVHAVKYLLNLQIDDVILGGRSQACPWMPKQAIKTLRSQKNKEGIKLILCMQLHIN